MRKDNQLYEGRYRISEERQRYKDSDKKRSPEPYEDLRTYRSIQVRPKPDKREELRYRSRSPVESYRQSSPYLKSTESYADSRADQQRYPNSPDRDISLQSNNYRSQILSPRRQSRSEFERLDKTIKDRSVSRSPERKVYRSSGPRYKESESKESSREKKRERSRSGSAQSYDRPSASKRSKLSRSPPQSAEKSVSRRLRSPVDRANEKVKSRKRYTDSRSRSRSTDRSFSRRSRSPEQWTRTVGPSKSDKPKSAKKPKGKPKVSKKAKERKSMEREKPELVPIPSVPSKWDSPEPKRNRWDEIPSRADLNMPLILNKAQEIATMLQIQAISESPPPHRKMKPHEKKAMEQKWSKLLSSGPGLSQIKVGAKNDDKESGSGGTPRSTKESTEKRDMAEDSDDEQNINVNNQNNKIMTKGDSLEVNLAQGAKEKEEKQADKSKKLVKAAKRNIRSRWETDSSESDSETGKPKSHSRSPSRSKERVDDKQRNKTTEISISVSHSKEKKDEKLNSSAKKDKKDDGHKRKRSKSRERSTDKSDSKYDRLSGGLKRGRSRDQSRDRSRERSRGRSRHRSRDRSSSRDLSRNRRSRERSRDRYRKDSGKHQLPDIVRSAKRYPRERSRSPRVFWFHREAYEDQLKKEKETEKETKSGSSKYASSSRSYSRRSRSRSRSRSYSPRRHRERQQKSRSGTPELTRAGATVSIAELKRKYKRSKSSDSSSSDSARKKKKKKEEAKDEKPATGRKESLDDLESFLGDLKKEKKKQWISEGKVKPDK